MLKQRLKRIYFELIKAIFSANAPKLLIIGAQKCGTTSLHFYLTQHPSFGKGFRKEAHFFNREIYFGKTLDEYQSEFFGKSSKIYIDATPAYLYQPDTAKNIYDAYPDIKMIVLLRDPVKRTYSAWNHSRLRFESEGYVKTKKNMQRRKGDQLYEKFFQDRKIFPTFREAIEIELELMKDNAAYEPALLRRSLYLNQLEEYWKYFDKDQIKIIGFKEFVSDVKGTLKNIEEFVDVQPHHWNNLKDEPRNSGGYVEPIKDEDKVFLENYFRASTSKLFEVIGKVDW